MSDEQFLLFSQTITPSRLEQMALLAELLEPGGALFGGYKQG